MKQNKIKSLCLIASLFTSGIFVNNANAKINLEVTKDGIDPKVSILRTWLGYKNITSVIELLNRADPDVRMTFNLSSFPSTEQQYTANSKKVLGAVCIETKMTPDEIKSLLNDFPNVRNIIITATDAKQSYNRKYTYRFNTSALSDDLYIADDNFLSKIQSKFYSIYSKTNQSQRKGYYPIDVDDSLSDFVTTNIHECIAAHSLNNKRSPIERIITKEDATEQLKERICLSLFGKNNIASCKCSVKKKVKKDDKPAVIVIPQCCFKVDGEVFWVWINCHYYPENETAILNQIRVVAQIPQTSQNSTDTIKPLK